MERNDYRLEIRPRLPAALERLDTLAENLFYSWDRRVRGLFFRIDAELWKRCEHNPKVFLRRVSQRRLDELAEDREFLLQYQDVLASFDAYLDPKRQRRGPKIKGFERDNELVAYFCMEFGLHESLKLYSGGLGILAGDHFKAASDLDLPFVGVGLMYRQGYFIQSIDRDGVQQMQYRAFDVEDLPVRPVTADDGEEIRVRVPFPGREVVARIWQADVGRVPLYLLDTDVVDNDEEDRAITYQLYGGDRRTRIAQEMVLGVGGVRALRALGLSPSAWHVNEGHPAFMILERCRERVAEGLEFEAALEAVAAATVFTTHTAVPAGHDRFTRKLAGEHLAPLAEIMGVPVERLLELGESPQSDDGFNMTALALRGSRRHNGVSRIHRDVAAEMEGYVWPEVAGEDNPITAISNGVHVPTFLAREWVSRLDSSCPEWRHQLNRPRFWKRVIEAMPDHRFWALIQSLKSEMLEDLNEILRAQYERNHMSRARIEALDEIFSAENTRPLVIGFARRFATYKRALLIFENAERLARLLNDPDRPVILIFAGKAHPQDMPGQALIRRIHEFAGSEPFVNRVFLVEGYDMALARKLVTGVDVWLNTPEYPLEASGTSGQKAAMNGAVNLSILDGWWAEGYDGANGWAIAPHGPDLSPAHRDRVEAQDLLDLLEDEVIPEYFDTGPGGYSSAWVSRCKRSMYTVLPRFNAQRMVMEYAERLYAPAAEAGRAMSAGEAERALELARWKMEVRERWPGMALEWVEAPPTAVPVDEPVRLQVRAGLNGVSPSDVRVECLLIPDLERNDRGRARTLVFEPGPEADADPEGGQIFTLDLDTTDTGLFHMRVRMYPCHDGLQHPLEMGLMRWL